jgi:Flp pilus assembly protein TadG
MQRLIRGLQRVAASFSSNTDGNLAIIFGIAFIPIIGLVGAAVDYSRANLVRAEMQNALDSTTLMLAKDPSLSSYTTTQLQQKASDYFSAIIGHTIASNAQINTPVVDTQASTVTATASSTVPTVFMKMLPFNVSNINMSISSTIAWGMTRLRVALVLDNTGSMAQSGKLPALQTATKNLLNQLKGAAAQNGDVYVSIIPFVKDVNLNPTNYTQTWVQWDDGTDASWDGTNGTCSKSGYSPRSKCVAQGTCSLSGYTTQSTCTGAGTCSISGYTTQSSCVAAGVCSKSNWTTQSSCSSHGGTWKTGTWTAATWTPATWTPKQHSTWKGCVMDRGDSTGPNAGNYDTNVATPNTGIPATLFPAEQYSTCPQAAMGLSYDWTTMTTLVDNMVAGGSTNQAIGLELGWMSLAGGGAFTSPAMDPNYKYTQVIVLLSDGLNTQDRWYGDGSSVSTQVDARQQITCNNLNAAGITVYTVQVNTDGSPTSTLLQNCAGSPGKYPDPTKFFLLTSANQIVSTFNQIGTNLSQLRIAK